MRSVLRGASGQKNNRNVRQLRMIAEAFADLQAVGIGQHDIKNQQIRAFTAPAQLYSAAPRLRAG